MKELSDPTVSKSQLSCTDSIVTMLQDASFSGRLPLIICTIKSLQVLTSNFILDGIGIIFHSCLMRMMDNQL